MGRIGYYVIGHPLASRDVGGAELQLYLIAKEAQKKGWETHFLVEDLKEDCVKDGQPLHRVESFRGGFAQKLKAAPTIAANSLLTYNSGSFDRVLRKISPDILHQRGSSIATGYFGSFAARNKKPFVFSTAALDDCTLKGNMWRGLLRQTVKKRLYLYGIQNASAVVVQAQYLKDAFEKTFPGKDVRVIPSGHPVPQEEPKKEEQPLAVWVGRVVDYKLPEMFVRLAEKMPEFNFELIGGIPRHDMFRKVMSEAGRLRNLKITGYMPNDRVNERLAAASALVDTSNAAGFPNTFIQAWLRKTPVVSLTIDPDGVIGKKWLGLVSGNEEQLGQDVRRILSEKNVRDRIGAGCYKYAKENHDILVTGEKYCEIYEELT